jgi:hypothetical protein
MLENTEASTILIGGDRQKTVVGDLDVTGTLMLNGEDLSAKIEELGSATSAPVAPLELGSEGSTNTDLTVNGRAEFMSGLSVGSNELSSNISIKGFLLVDGTSIGNVPSLSVVGGGINCAVEGTRGTMSLDVSKDEFAASFTNKTNTNVTSIAMAEDIVQIRSGAGYDNSAKFTLSPDGVSFQNAPLASLTVDHITAKEVPATNSYVNNIQNGKKSNHLLLENQYGKITFGETVISDAGQSKTVSNVKVETKPPNQTGYSVLDLKGDTVNVFSDRLINLSRENGAGIPVSIAGQTTIGTTSAPAGLAVNGDLSVSGKLNDVIYVEKNTPSAGQNKARIYCNYLGFGNSDTFYMQFNGTTLKFIHPAGTFNINFTSKTTSWD